MKAPERESAARAAGRIVLALLFFAVGIIHLKSPGGFMPIMPDWVPYPRQVIIATGWCELFGAAGLLAPVKRLRWWAGLMLALYAVCVYPANIKHAVDHVTVAGVSLGWAYHAPRLLLQPVIVWWALFAGGVIDWPWRR
ncbi:DoxX family protein [Sphingomonas sp. GlSt437]|uniref:DoxX family protein n=1 Tax=Sphingomonas sp. GlSt437 TaxID=3389970 RepID=UPI003A885987